VSSERYKKKCNRCGAIGGYTGSHQHKHKIFDLETENQNLKAENNNLKKQIAKLKQTIIEIKGADNL